MSLVGSMTATALPPVVTWMIGIWPRPVYRSGYLETLGQLLCCPWGWETCCSSKPSELPLSLRHADDGKRAGIIGIDIGIGVRGI